MVERFIAFFLGLSGIWVAGIVFALAFAEAALFFGFFLPAEIAVVLGGVLASRGSATLWQVLPATILGAIIGDSVGYALGRRFGAPFLARKLGKKWQTVESFLQRHGAAAVFFGRFSAFLRAAVPSAAGAAHIPYGKFLFWNVVGGVVWGAGFCLLGFFAAESYEQVLKWGGYVGIGVLVVAAVIVLVVVRRLRRRR
nr:VTT domain-containing protein [Planctomycetota bacterium]